MSEVDVQIHSRGRPRYNSSESDYLQLLPKARIKVSSPAWRHRRYEAFGVGGLKLLSHHCDWCHRQGLNKAAAALVSNAAAIKQFATDKRDTRQLMTLTPLSFLLSFFCVCPQRLFSLFAKNFTFVKNRLEFATSRATSWGELTAFCTYTTVIRLQMKPISCIWSAQGLYYMHMCTKWCSYGIKKCK